MQPCSQHAVSRVAPATTLGILRYVSILKGGMAFCCFSQTSHPAMAPSDSSLAMRILSVAKEPKSGDVPGFRLSVRIVCAWETCVSCVRRRGRVHAARQPRRESSQSCACALDGERGEGSCRAPLRAASVGHPPAPLPGRRRERRGNARWCAPSPAGSRRPRPQPAHMRKTPCSVGGMGALAAVSIASERTARVCAGSMMPSSQRREVA